MNWSLFLLKAMGCATCVNWVIQVNFLWRNTRLVWLLLPHGNGSLSWWCGVCGDFFGLFVVCCGFVCFFGFCLFCFLSQNTSSHWWFYSLRSVRAVALAELFKNVSFGVYKHSFWNWEKWGKSNTERLFFFFFPKPCDQYLHFLKDWVTK